MPQSDDEPSALWYKFETSIDLCLLFLVQEDIIFSVVGDVKPEDMPDFIVTEDVTGVNAGLYICAFSLHLCLHFFVLVAYALKGAVVVIVVISFPVVDNVECGAGMFFFRNSDWSRQFLDRWWDQTDFIQPFGQSKSGDNTALKHLVNIMDKDEFKRHVRIPEMQCLFNSNLWRPSWRSCHRLITVTKAVWQGRFLSPVFLRSF